MKTRNFASKASAVVASVALVGGGASWIATTGGGSPEPGTEQQAPRPTVKRVYLVQRVSADGSRYFEPVAAPPTMPALAPRPVTRTRVS